MLDLFADASTVLLCCDSGLPAILLGGVIQGKMQMTALLHLF
jgi:hypothetical protein